MFYILRFGEITLKGKNRSMFEDRLKGNIVKLFGDLKFQKAGGRFYVEGKEGLDFRKVFGIVSYSPARKVDLSYEAIERAVLRACEGHEGSFGMDTQRLNKQFKHTSMELNRKLGQAVVDKYDLEVDLDNPGLKIGVEIMRDAAYIFTESIGCFGGLPVGIEGRVAVLMHDNNSLLAALLMMKRGCSVVPVGEGDVSLLRSFGCEEKVVDEIPEDVQAMVVGDTLKRFKGYNVSLPVLRPLIGFDEEMIEEKLREYESIR